jgi:CheY-like chemotaxis protein
VVIPRLLVVDDDAAVRRVVAAALRQWRYHVAEAASGVEAMHIAATAPALDLVLTEVVMPDMRGDHMIRELRRAGHRQRVIYITGYVDRLYDARVSLGGDESYLEKPFSMTELHDAVSLALFTHRGGVVDAPRRRPPVRGPSALHASMPRDASDPAVGAAAALRDGAVPTASRGTSMACPRCSSRDVTVWKNDSASGMVEVLCRYCHRFTAV